MIDNGCRNPHVRNTNVWSARTPGNERKHTDQELTHLPRCPACSLEGRNERGCSSGRRKPWDREPGRRPSPPRRDRSTWKGDEKKQTATKASTWTLPARTRSPLAQPKSLSHVPWFLFSSASLTLKCKQCYGGLRINPLLATHSDQMA